jgi:hypothetical protein
MRVTRQEWAKRVERWGESGLTANEFASELGINARTLVYWKWRLGKDSARRTTPERAIGRARAKEGPLRLLEVSPVTVGDSRVEIELRNGRKLQVPATFDAEALGRVVRVLEGVA